jgi:undecaprenyl-diphosphatase
MHQAVIIIAKYFIGFSAVLAFWAFVEQPRDKKKEFILVGVIGGIIAVALAKLGGHFYYDPRPFVVGHFKPYFYHAPDNGFPSTHALVASFLAFVCWPFSKRFSVMLFILAIAIGAARVRAGVHHPIDIIGGFVFSGIGVLIAVYIAKRFKHTKATYVHHSHAK